MAKKLYDPPKAGGDLPATQLDPTGLSRRPLLKDGFRAVIDDVGGDLTYPARPDPHQGEVLGDPVKSGEPVIPSALVDPQLIKKKEKI